MSSVRLVLTVPARYIDATKDGEEPDHCLRLQCHYPWRYGCWQLHRPEQSGAERTTPGHVIVGNGGLLSRAGATPGSRCHLLLDMAAVKSTEEASGASRFPPSKEVRRFRVRLRGGTRVPSGASGCMSPERPLP